MVWSQRTPSKSLLCADEYIASVGRNECETAQITAVGAEGCAECNWRKPSCGIGIHHTKIPRFAWWTSDAAQIEGARCRMGMVKNSRGRRRNYKLHGKSVPEKWFSVAPWERLLLSKVCIKISQLYTRFCRYFSLVTSALLPRGHLKENTRNKSQPDLLFPRFAQRTYSSSKDRFHTLQNIDTRERA